MIDEFECPKCFHIYAGRDWCAFCGDPCPDTRRVDNLIEDHWGAYDFVTDAVHAFSYYEARELSYGEVGQCVIEAVDWLLTEHADDFADDVRAMGCDFFAGASLVWLGRKFYGYTLPAGWVREAGVA